MKRWWGSLLCKIGRHDFSGEWEGPGWSWGGMMTGSENLQMRKFCQRRCGEQTRRAAIEWKEYDPRVDGGWG